MKRIRANIWSSVVALISLVTIVSFQNCSGVSFGGQQNGLSAASGSPIGTTSFTGLPPVTSCSASTQNNCNFSASNSGDISGSCGVGYTGTCAASCGSSGTWTVQSNSCTAIVPPPPPPPNACNAGTFAHCTFGGTGGNPGELWGTCDAGFPGTCMLACELRLVNQTLQTFFYMQNNCGGLDSFIGPID